MSIPDYLSNEIDELDQWESYEYLASEISEISKHKDILGFDILDELQAGDLD